jgi:Rieske Fe-S protein
MLTVLVTQPKEGTFKAFDATCTHAGCIVSGVENSEIFCGCHGARFDSESGMVLTGPARNALGKLNLELRGEELWVTI